jgi:hypothetical protein
MVIEIESFKDQFAQLSKRIAEAQRHEELMEAIDDMTVLLTAEKEIAQKIWSIEEESEQPSLPWQPRAS